MGKVWVRLLVTKTVRNEHCTFERRMAGEWVEVQAGQAKLWVAADEAEILRADIRAKVVSFETCGVVITGGDVEQGKETIHAQYSELAVQGGAPSLPYPQTLLWDTNTPLRTELMMVGFHRLTTGWQVAAPIWRYRRLANGIGTEEDRQRTQAVVHDLRMPVYDTGLVYVRRCPQTKALIDQWLAERKEGDSDKLAFLRALYVTKPIICALPVTWIAGTSQ